MDVSHVKESSSSGTVYGVVVGELSPVKTSSKNRECLVLSYSLRLANLASLSSTALFASLAFPVPVHLVLHGLVNYSGNSLCDESTYQPYMERQ